MQAEIIAIGDELTSGQRLDTNSQWISERLEEIGIRVLYHTTVGDDLNAHVAVVCAAVERADVVVSTGGLGPTADDLTRQALAEATGRPLVEDPTALEQIRLRFAIRNRPMPARNVVQALFPQGSRVIANPHGTAPGIEMEVARSGRPPVQLFALPGVPAEMREMWCAVASRLNKSERRVIRHRRIKCFGVGESDLEQMLPDLIRRGRLPRVGITVSQATITLRITADGADEAACWAAMQPTCETICQCLGDLVFGEEDEELQHAVMRLLEKRRATLAVVECGTGGLLTRWLNEADVSGARFLGAVNVSQPRSPMLRSWKLPENMNGHVPAGLLARRCREHFDADYSLAVGPAPRPLVVTTGGQAVPLAVAAAGGEIEDLAPLAGHPDILEARTAKYALNLLRKQLLLAQEMPRENEPPRRPPA